MVLDFEMTALSTQAGIVYMPRTWVRIVVGSRVSRRLRALVDSGAQLTVASHAVATELGLQHEFETAPQCELGAVGGVQQLAHELRVGLVVGPGGRSTLQLPGARVFFVESLLGDYDVLLGQVDALERLTYSQRNQPRVRTFSLGLPL